MVTRQRQVGHAGVVSCHAVLMLCCTFRSMLGMQDLNAQFEGSLKKLLCRKLRPHVDEAILISIDKLGADVRVRVGSDYSVERIGWQQVHLPRLYH